MNLARYGRLRLLIGVLLVVWVAVWVFGPNFGIVIPFEPFIAIEILIVVGGYVLLLLAVRAIRSDAKRVVAAHPDAVAFPTSVSSWPGTDRADRESVIVVVGDRRGLSFRDRADREVLLVPPDRIMSVELAPFVPLSASRPFRVTTVDGTFDFNGPRNSEAQVDAVVALRRALGRAAG